MTAVNPGASQQAVVEAALVLLERMGLSPADLAAVPQPRTPVPTFAEYVPVVSAGVSDGTRRAYGSYWNRIVDHWGDRRLDEPTPSDIRQLMAYVKTHVVARRNARGGRSAEEHLVAALRCLYQRAVEDGLIAEADNPARKVAKPRRLPSTRRAVPDTRLAQINEAAAATGDDPVLDTLLLRLHTETACRRGGALALRPDDLDPDQCLIRLREKGETVRWQPVSPTLMGRLVQYGRERHAPPDGQLLRYASGRPITSRRYDHLWTRLGRHLPWVRTQQISMHWIRPHHPDQLARSSASRSPKPTQAMKTAAGECGEWRPWPRTSAQGCPKWRQHPADGVFPVDGAYPRWGPRGQHYCERSRGSSPARRMVTWRDAGRVYARDQVRREAWSARCSCLPTSPTRSAPWPRRTHPPTPPPP